MTWPFKLLMKVVPELNFLSYPSATSLECPLRAGVVHLCLIRACHVIPKGKTLCRLVGLGDCGQEMTNCHHQGKHTSEILSDKGPPCRLYLGSHFPASQWWRLSLASLGFFGPTKPKGNTKYNGNKRTTNHQRKKSRNNKHILSTAAKLQGDCFNSSRKINLK